MLREDYLTKKNQQLEEKKRFHVSFLKAYRIELEKKQDPDIETKVKKKAKLFEKREKHFEEKAVKVDTAHKKRVWEIDFLRAIVIFGMLIDHFIQDFRMFFPEIFDHDAYWANTFLSNAYNNAGVYTGSDIRVALRFIGIIVLAVLIGINTYFSKNNWKRFLILFGLGIIINIFYAVCASKGVLGYSIMNIFMSYALAMLIYCLFELAFKRFKKVWKWICLGTGLAMFIGWGFIRYSTILGPAAPADNLFFFIFNGGSSRIPRIEADIGELTFSNWLTIILGIDRFGTECLGIFPWVGYIFIGSFIGQTVYAKKQSLLRFFDKEGEMTTNEKFNRVTSPFLFFGHHTVLIYIFHQPAYTIFAWIVFGLFMGIPPIF